MQYPILEYWPKSEWSMNFLKCTWPLWGHFSFASHPLQNLGLINGFGVGICVQQHPTAPYAHSDSRNVRLWEVHSGDGIWDRLHEEDWPSCNWCGFGIDRRIPKRKTKGPVAGRPLLYVRRSWKGWAWHRHVQHLFWGRSWCFIFSWCISPTGCTCGCVD